MKVKIIANPKKSWARRVASELKAVLAPKHSIVRKDAEVTICIGGDGTILYANHKGRIEGAILGIGGDKSYICQIHHRNWRLFLLKLLDDHHREKIMTLTCKVAGKKFHVMNDVVIHATRYRVAEMDVTAGGDVHSFEGDGMIVSSAIGSAAYAYSAGGAKFKPTERKIAVVPICAYKRAFLPEVLNENGKVSIKAGADCAFIIDGIFIRNLKSGEIVNVEKGSDMIFFSGVGKND
ncbi:NAD kinase [Candidatus Bilamarchaeum dharawalense]|uniref:NAD kinase n=1 Tax=Candidatus Bilamarchaeum dharawalense TaxID=2885759 RepID=A0A5E4LQW9_9ARCH|nr:NAD kinase [Candidatus Bilamarchaeum dharawalense]